MKRIKTFREINEYDYDDYDDYNYYYARRKDPDDYEPTKERELAEKDKLFTTIGLTGWLALLFKNSNPKELWALNLEDSGVEELVNDYSYGYDGEYEDLDHDGCEDLATDIFTGSHSKTKYPPEMGVGMKGWDEGCALIKLDDEFGEFILNEILSEAYKENPRASQISGAKSRAENKAMVDAIVKSFPDIDI